MKARIAAEMRLRAAEGSLQRLENVVEDEKNKFDVEVKEEMVVNVKKLKGQLTFIVYNVTLK